jgi:hypothetical protein
MLVVKGTLYGLSQQAITRYKLAFNHNHVTRTFHGESRVGRIYLSLSFEPTKLLSRRSFSLSKSHFPHVRRGSEAPVGRPCVDKRSQVDFGSSFNSISTSRSSSFQRRRTAGKPQREASSFRTEATRGRSINPNVSSECEKGLLCRRRKN